MYNNSEAAFQAQKTEEWERYRFSGLSARDAKKLGRKVVLHSDWETVKDDLMYEICKAKMQQNHLESLLLETGDAELVEVNIWHDNYWGICTCGKCKDGRNQLGKTWMQIRNELKLQLDNA